MLIPIEVQLQAVNRLLRAGDEKLSADEFRELGRLLPHFGEPWHTHVEQLLKLADLANGYERARLIDNYRDDGRIKKEEWEQLYEAKERRVDYPPVSQVLASLPDYDWLWKGWIPRGLWALLAAPGGTGKSYFALDLARRIGVGSGFPDGAPCKPGNVLWVDAENRPSILKQRLGVWQEGELERFYLMLADPQRWIINFDGFDDRDRFLGMLWRIRPDLVIVDSYGAASYKGENTKEDVQHFLAFLNQAAVEFDCGLLVIHHLRKSPGGQKSFLPMTLDSVRGSSHIGAMASVVIGMQWIPTSADPDPNGPRRLWCLKNNVSQHPQPLGVLLEPDKTDTEVAMVRYVDAPMPYKRPTKTEVCGEWLVETLRANGEPMRPGELLELAREEGFSRSIFYRARKYLDVRLVDTEGRQHPENRWALPEMVTV